ncbi:MAG: hypothetical protein CUN52_08130 [Phototrophicales bacterium]|nr:MAG: hypothetical protein CUN52_08130 [Phototrophicales bacterium]
MKLRFFSLLTLCLCLFTIQTQFVLAGANDNNVQWAELYHQGPTYNSRTEFVPFKPYTFFSVDTSSNFYPSTQVRVSILVDNNDITSANVVYWDGDSTEFASMSYDNDFTDVFHSQPSNTYSIWSVILPAPKDFSPPQGAGFNLCYRIQVNDGTDSDYLNFSSGDWQNPLDQWVMDNDSTTGNFCQLVNSYPQVNFSVTSNTAPESTTDRGISLSLSSSIDEPVTVTLTYSDNTATLADGDYNNTTTSITIPAGVTSYSTTLVGLVNNDSKYELNEDFNITLSGVSTGNATIGASNTLNVTIQNDDPIPSVIWSATTASHTEGNSGSTGHTLGATLSNPSYENIVVNVAATDVTATNTVDYTAGSTITFTSGTTTANLSYTIIGDVLAEGNETFTLTLNSIGSGTATIGSPSVATITIIDDDTAGYNVNTSTVTAISEPSTTTTFTIQLNTMPSGTVDLAFGSTDPSECLPSPTTLTFDNTNWNTPQVITITAQDDALLDGPQPCAVTITRTGGTASEYASVPNPANVATTVNDDEAPNTLSATAVCVGNDLQVTISAGDANFDITGTGAGLPVTNVGFGTHTLTGPSTWIVSVIELGGDIETLNLGTFSCPVSVPTPTPPPAPVSAPPPIPQRCDIGGYSLVMPEGIFCTNLFANGVFLIPGSVPGDLASLTLGAVDIGKFDGEKVVPGEFGTGLPICLRGSGRLIFLDGSTSPRARFELETFTIDGKTCGFIINSGTVVLITR